MSSTLVMMAGLPASGKTTTAMHLHAQLGGLLIRSCDVYKELGIVLSEWVNRTQGFKVDVTEYDRRRADAYDRMAKRVDSGLAGGVPVVIVDAVHSEYLRRRRLYEICHTRGATPVLVVCLCEDFEEVRRRFCARQGREMEPEHEASDLSVFHDIHRRWQSPVRDELLDGTRPTILTCDTAHHRADVIHIGRREVAEPVLTALRMWSPSSTGTSPA